MIDDPNYEAGYDDAYKEIFGAIRVKFDELREVRDGLLEKGEQNLANKYEFGMCQIKRLAERIYGEQKASVMNVY